MHIASGNRHGLSNVLKGTEQTLKLRNSQQQFTVIGDGRLEAVMMDGFHSATAIQSIADPRVSKFRDEVLSNIDDLYQDNVGELVQRHFGPSWSGSMSRREVTATHVEGDSTLRLTVQSYSDTGKKTILSATVDTADTSLTQRVQQQLGDDPVEFLLWEPSKAATARELSDLNKKLQRCSESLA